VGTVWPGKESIVGPVAWSASWSAPGFVLVGVQARPGPWSIPCSA